MSTRQRAQVLAQETVRGRSPDSTNKVTSQPFSAPFSERRALLIVGDAVVAVLAALVASSVWHMMGSADSDTVMRVAAHWYWFAVLPGGWWVVAWLMDLYYIPDSFNRRASVTRIVIAGVTNLVAYLIVFLLIPSDLSRPFLLFLMLIVWLAIACWRWAYAILFSMPSFEHRLLIVGHGARAQSIANVLDFSPMLNFRVVGFYANGSTQPGSRSERSHRADGNKGAGLYDLARNLQAHRVVVAVDESVDKELFYQLVECQANGIGVSLMADLYEQVCRKIPVELLDPAWVLNVLQGRRVFTRMQLGMKRVMDLTLGLAAFIGFAFLLPFVALAIRLDSAGPIFYRQIRCGRAGKPFRVVKFRTMDPNAEGDGRARWATEDDPRITRVGRLLRKSRLDELPQVINVLKGEMSFVGPRPERPEFIDELERYVPFYRIRLMVKPGITGWAQTQYGYGNSTDDALVKLQYDFYYLRNWSLWLDLYILVKTFGVVFKLGGM